LSRDTCLSRPKALGDSWLVPAISAILVSLLLVTPLALSAQPEEESISRSSLEDLERRLEDAKDLFFVSTDPVEPLQQFSSLLEDLEDFRLAEEDVGAEPVERLIVEVLSYRTQLNLNRDRLDLVDVDMRRMLRLDPDYEYDSAQVSRKLIERFEDLRNQLVAFVEVQVSPEDAEVRVNGKLLEFSKQVVALELESVGGTAEITAERPGYRSTKESLYDLPAGAVTRYELEMERVGPALRFETVPSGAEVTLTGGAQDKIERRSPLWVGLEPGKYEVEVRVEGYRTKKGPLSLWESRDYSFVERLERTGGVVSFQPFLEGDEIRVDGEEASPERLSEARIRLKLPPGEHRFLISGDGGVFERTVELEDRGDIEIEVEKRPGVALVGILGGDRVAADRLRENLLVTARSELEGWTLLDRSEVGLSLLQELGLDADLLRSAAETGRILGSDIDWRTIQARAASIAPASVLLLAALSDDVMASEADLWFLPAPPGPAFPDYRRVRLSEGPALSNVLSDFDRPLDLHRVWLGALMIDSYAADGPVVASIDPHSPAAAAGFEVGDEVVSIAGTKVARVSDAHALLESSHESSLQVIVRRSQRQRTLRVTLSSSPVVIRHNAPSLIYASIAARLSVEGTEIPEWLKKLNLGMVFLNAGAWEDALYEFRTADGFPRDHALGQAAADYWLGVCLQSIGPDYYGEAAAAFRRAAGASGARLYHNDGPLIAPRAKARLAELGSQN
jgi:hypothetical protein